MAAEGTEPAWVRIQKKTFTKWVNMHLNKRRHKMDELQSGLEDGIKLVNLVEILGNVSLGNFNKNPKMRIQKIENVGKALTYIKSTGVHLENMSAEDIVDKNLKLDLGLIWTIIQKFAIADISLEELTAKEALLLWCRRKTEGYKNVTVQNFTSSFQDGLALCALIHVHRPNLIPYDTLNKNDPHKNLEVAFSVAEKDLGIPRLLDVEDMDMPDERSVITYVSLYYHYFASSREQENAARRVGKLVAFTKSLEEMQEDYKVSAEALSKWIKDKTSAMEDRDFGNSLDSVKQKLQEFEGYKEQEKPPKNTERLELEGKYNNIALKLRANNRPPFVPPAGLSMPDINSSWDNLGDAENRREAALRAELARQQKIADLLKQFRAKAQNLESWAAGKNAYLQKKEDIDTLSAAQTALKLLDAHDQEYDGSHPRVGKLHNIGEQIIALGASESGEVKDRMNGIDNTWGDLKNGAVDKRKWLNDELAKQQRMEELRKEFARQAKEFNRWVKDKSEELAGWQFGDTLDSVLAHEKVLDSDDQSINQQSAEKKAALDKVWNELQALGVKDNRYTPFTIDDIGNFQKALAASQAKRRDAYAAEVARQEAMEAKRKEFAAAAQAFVDFLAQNQAKIDALDGEPKPLISAIQGHHKNGAEGAARLADLAKLDAECKALGITDNKHTPHTLPSLASRNRDHNTYIVNYVAELEEEQKIKDDFDSRIKALLDWVHATIPKLEERSFDNTLAGAQAKVAGFIKYKSTEKAEKVSDKLEIESLNESISNVLKDSKHNRPAFAPAVTVADVAREWAVLDGAEKAREEALYGELRRQEHLKELVSHFDSEAAALDAWAANKEVYLNTKETIDTLSAAQVQKTLLNAFNDEYAASQARVNAFKSQGAAIIDGKYHKAADIQARIDGIEQRWADLQRLSNAKAELNAAEFAKFEEKCKEFGAAAQAFVDFLGQQRAALDALQGEPEPLKAQITAFWNNGETVRAKLAEVEELHKRLRAMNITENKHTAHTFEDLKARVRQLEAYVREYLDELSDEQDVKNNYAQRAAALSAWVDSTIPALGDRSFDNTLAGAKLKLSEFYDYRNNVKANKYADKSMIESLFNLIGARLSSSAHKRPTFSPELPPSALDAKLQQLNAEEKSREDALVAELRRQEKLDTLVKNFDAETAELDSFADKKEQYLTAKENITTLTSAQVQLTVLKTSDEEYGLSLTRLNTFKALGAQIVGDNYVDSRHINATVSRLEERWAKLKALSNAKQQQLAGAEEAEKKKEKLRVEFAAQIKAYNNWARDTIAVVHDHHFGSSLESVRGFSTTLDANDVELTSTSSAKKGVVENLWNQLQQAGATDNHHTSFTVQDAQTFHAQLETALRNRRKAHETELKQQEANEAKRLEFANAAAEFVKFVESKRAQIEAVSGSPQQRIDAVTALYGNGADVAKEYDHLVAIDASAKAMGITDNRHTEHTVVSLNGKVNQYHSFFKNILASIEEDRALEERTRALQKEWEAKEKFENTRILYANDAQKLGLWLESAADEVSSQSKVDTVDEALALQKKLESFSATAAGQQPVHDNLVSLASQLNGQEVPPIAEVTNKWNQALEQLEQRKGILAQEVERQRSNEQLRVNFAKIADELNTFIASIKAKIGSLSGSLEDQLSTLNQKTGEMNTAGRNKLEKVEEANQQLVSANVTENKHTNITLGQLRASFAKLVDLLNENKKLLEGEILKKKGAQITQQQLEEFRESFNHFDRSKNGQLSPLEFKGVLQSLGVEADDAEVDRIVKEVGNPETMLVNFEQFVSFMEKRTRDQDSKDEIIKSFKLIAANKDFITEADMRSVMKPEEVAYLVAHMPLKGGASEEPKAYDYVAWADKVYPNA